ncbi:hypothetical protein [Sphingomonas jaspsi]|uniref:hypothetical protein n=1 Tax=Sphingomonas jaspsi TaxID=392409 RepID=UPI0012EC3FF5|nr:hypothetical protein [Sphingomonas jaspsi]
MPLSQLVEFDQGFPDGDILWSLLDARGLTVASGSVTPAADSVSAIIFVSGDDNTIEPGLLASPRELAWVYTAGGMVVNGRRRYRLEAFLPLGLSEDGVRRKLGVEPHELGDEAIDLVGAYGRFRETVGADNLTAVELAGGHDALLVCDAIEAFAAISLIPSLQVSLAAKEASGTNQFQRATINWQLIRAQLEGYISDGTLAAAPELDPTLNTGALLVVVVRDDPVTGTTA